MFLNPTRTVLLISSFLLLVGLFACEKKSGTPAYIHIDKFNFTALPSEGSASNKITDVWVYVNGQALGAYELPCTFPVLAEGNADIIISPGIMRNGIADKRAAYAFYSSYKITDKLIPLVTDTIVPSFNYLSGIQYKLIEDFEIGCAFTNNLGSDTGIIRASRADAIFEGTYGQIVLDAAHPYSEVLNSTALVLPTDGTPIFAELNYKNDIPFTVGVVGTVTGSLVKYWQVTLNPKTSWNKVYVDLTDVVAGLRGTSYQLMFKATLPSDKTTAEINLDNIKIITR
jgi:hypothetical protein